MKLTPGSRWISTVCNTEVVVIKAPQNDVPLQCADSPMAPVGTARSANLLPAAAAGGGSLLGKRYTDLTTGVELLCTKGGSGSMSIEGRALTLMATTPLPSSD